MTDIVNKFQNIYNKINNKLDINKVEYDKI